VCCAPRDSPDVIREHFFEKWARPGSCDPVNVGALNANSSKMAKETNFKFGRCAARDSPDMTRDNFSKSGCGQGHVTP